MQPRFFTPTYPVEDFSLSISDIFQSWSFLVLHDELSLTDLIWLSTIMRFWGQSLQSTATNRKAFFLVKLLLHLGGMFWPSFFEECPVGNSNKHLSSKCGTKYSPVCYFKLGNFCAMDLQICIYPLKVWSKSWVFFSKIGLLIILLLRSWISFSRSPLNSERSATVRDSMIYDKLSKYI